MLKFSNTYARDTFAVLPLRRDVADLLGVQHVFERAETTLARGNYAYRHILARGSRWHEGFSGDEQSFIYLQSYCQLE